MGDILERKSCSLPSTIMKQHRVEQWSREQLHREVAPSTGEIDSPCNVSCEVCSTWVLQQSKHVNTHFGAVSFPSAASLQGRVVKITHHCQNSKHKVTPTDKGSRQLGRVKRSSRSANGSVYSLPFVGCTQVLKLLPLFFALFFPPLISVQATLQGLVLTSGFDGNISFLVAWLLGFHRRLNHEGAVLRMRGNVGEDHVSAKKYGDEVCEIRFEWKVTETEEAHCVET